MYCICSILIAVDSVALSTLDASNSVFTFLIRFTSQKSDVKFVWSGIGQIHRAVLKNPPNNGPPCIVAVKVLPIFKID
jgi:hypothetical protein